MHYVIQLEWSNGMWGSEIVGEEPSGYVFSGSYADCVEYTYNWSY